MASCDLTLARTFRKYDDQARLIVEVTNCQADSSGNVTENIVDLSGIIDAKIILRAPDYTSKVFNGSLYTDGTDGMIYYSTTGDPANKTGDLDQEGKWAIQARVTLPNGTWTTNFEYFTVSSVLDE